MAFDSLPAAQLLHMHTIPIFTCMHACMPFACINYRDGCRRQETRSLLHDFFPNQNCTLQPRTRLEIKMLDAFVGGLVLVMLITGTANTLLSKLQDNQCVRNCS